jgi:hypothetical protein
VSVPQCDTLLFPSSQRLKFTCRNTELWEIFGMSTNYVEELAKLDYNTSISMSYVSFNLSRVTKLL